MEIKERIANWVRASRKAAKLSGEELGAKLALELRTTRGHSKGNISHWELGKHEPSLQQLLAISKITGIPLPPEVQTLKVIAGNSPTSDADVGKFAAIPGEFQRVTAYDPNDPRNILIRTVQLQLRAGITGFHTVPDDDDDAEVITVTKGWLQRKGLFAEDLIAMKVKGESMEETLFDGDVVIVNTADREKKHGEVYAFNFGGEAVIKRLHYDMRQWYLFSDSSDQKKYHRQRCEGAECLVVGKIVRVMSDYT